MNKGLLITFEGSDGLGKTRQVEMLIKALEKRGASVYSSKEPGNGLPGGGSPLGPPIREALFHSPEDGGLPAHARQILLLADHIDNVRRCAPVLEEGGVVVCDRYTDSAFAYAAVHNPPTSPEVLRLWEQFSGPVPDITILLFAIGRRVVDPVDGIYDDINWSLHRARKRMGPENGKQQGKGWNDYAAQRLIQRSYLALLSGQSRTVFVRVGEDDGELEVHGRILAAVDLKLQNLVNARPLPRGVARVDRQSLAFQVRPGLD